MVEDRRRSPFIWVSWLAPLLSGDRHCEWAAWYKAHFQYRKRRQDNENALTKWKADHAEMVRAQVRGLRDDGWRVSVEDQNKITLTGKTATVGGVVDIVAQRDGSILIVDCKTGRERDSDYWQVLAYMAFLPLVYFDMFDEPFPSGAVVEGRLVYRDRTRAVDRHDDSVIDGRRALTLTGEVNAPRVSTREMVFARVRAVATDTAPSRTPSASECRFCDVAACPDRVEQEIGVEPAATTEEF